MRTPKIVFIGAGSMSFGTPTFRDIFTSPKMKGATLSLVDIDPENLERMYGLAVKLNEHTGWGLTIEKTGDRREVLLSLIHICLLSRVAVEEILPGLGIQQDAVKAHVPDPVNSLGAEFL